MVTTFCTQFLNLICVLVVWTTFGVGVLGKQNAESRIISIHVIPPSQVLTIEYFNKWIAYGTICLFLLSALAKAVLLVVKTVQSQ